MDKENQSIEQISPKLLFCLDYKRGFIFAYMGLLLAVNFYGHAEAQVVIGHATGEARVEINFGALNFTQQKGTLNKDGRLPLPGESSLDRIILNSPSLRGEVNVDSITPNSELNVIKPPKSVMISNKPNSVLPATPDENDNSVNSNSERMPQAPERERVPTISPNQAKISNEEKESQKIINNVITKTETRVAEIPTPNLSVDSGKLNLNDRILTVIKYSGSESQLNSELQDQLKLVADLVRGTDRRLQLNGYAGGPDEAVGVSRRLSLSRTLTVRAYLIDLGIPSSNIDVRALGFGGNEEFSERVDILLDPV